MRNTPTTCPLARYNVDGDYNGDYEEASDDDDEDDDADADDTDVHHKCIDASPTYRDNPRHHGLATNIGMSTTNSDPTT